MKLIYKPLASLVFGCIALTMAAGSWAIPPSNFSFDPVVVSAQPMIQCANFWVMGDWTYTEYGKTHFDREGIPVRVNGFRVITDQRVYNSEDDSFQITIADAAGRGEHQHFVVRFGDFFYMEAGINTRIIVPGWGPMVVNTGQIRFESEDGLFWYVTKFTPNLAVSEEEKEAICSYLDHE